MYKIVRTTTLVDCIGESMTMGFINFLQKSNIYRTIMLLVNRFLKYVSFMPDKAGCTAKEAVKLFFKVVVKY